MELLEVRNVSDHDVILRHDREGDVLIKPNSSRIVPLHVAAVNFGNPAARNEGKNRLRDAEIAHVQTWWGFYPGMYPDAAWTDRVMLPNVLPETWVGPCCPPCEVYDLESKERVWMVHDDPHGEHMLSQGVIDNSVGSDERFLHARISQLEAQLQQLLNIATARGSIVAPDESTAEDDAVLASVGAAMQTIQSEAVAQAERNQQRDEIPPPPPDTTVRPDNPRTTRSGARASAASK